MKPSHKYTVGQDIFVKDNIHTSRIDQISYDNDVGEFTYKCDGIWYLEESLMLYGGSLKVKQEGIMSEAKSGVEWWYILQIEDEDNVACDFVSDGAPFDSEHLASEYISKYGYLGEVYIIVKATKRLSFMTHVEAM